jgi:hypothetical protein
MRRTNIYLEEEQDALLRRLSEQRKQPVAALVRAAVDEWLERQGVQAVEEDEWQRRFTALLNRRAWVGETAEYHEQQVAADVAAVVTEVRAQRASARRR